MRAGTEGSILHRDPGAAERGEPCCGGEHLFCGYRGPHASPSVGPGRACSNKAVPSAWPPGPRRAFPV